MSPIITGRRRATENRPTSLWMVCNNRHAGRPARLPASSLTRGVTRRYNRTNERAPRYRHRRRRLPPAP
ncbi:hypothetical protein BCEP4_1330049 [Burkholderia cepacia]|nr:hypothetical protein BCEP4_1330049 [Burkholderia cepacia]